MVVPVSNAFECTSLVRSNLETISQHDFRRLEKDDFRSKDINAELPSPGVVDNCSGNQIELSKCVGHGSMCVTLIFRYLLNAIVSAGT